MRPTKEVVFYGGLKGEDSNNEIFLFNPNTNAWLSVNPSVSTLTTPIDLPHLNLTRYTHFTEPIARGAAQRRPRDERFERRFLPGLWRLRQRIKSQRACEVYHD